MSKVNSGHKFQFLWKWDKMDDSFCLGRYAVLITSGYISGLCICRTTPTFGFNTVLFLAVLAVFIFFQFFFHLALKKSCKTQLIFLLTAAMFFLGVYKTVFWKCNTISFIRDFDGSDALFNAEIASDPQKIGSNGYIGAQIITYDMTCGSKKHNVNDRFFLIFKECGSEKPKFGDKIKFNTKIDLNGSYSDTYRNINCVLPLKTDFYIKTGTTDNFKFTGKLYRYAGIFLKSKITHAADEVFSYSKRSSSVIKAIITGDKTDFSNCLYSNFASAGFLHITAVSGMHVSILFSVISGLMAVIKIRKKISVILIPFIIVLFCSVAGFTPSVLRAAIMMIIAGFSTVFGREYDSLTSLFLSALAILSVYPFALFSPGFLLSFGTTLGICVIFKPFMKLKFILAMPRSLKWIAASFATSFSAFLGMLPFEIYFFGDINFTSLITNLWVVPAVTYIFSLGLANCIFYYIFRPFSIYLLRYFTEPFIILVLESSDIFSDEANISFDIFYMPGAFYILYTGFAIAFIYWLKIRKK